MNLRWRIGAAFAAAIMLFGVVTPSVQAATVKAGASCTTVGKATKVGTKTYVCTKVGKTKVWKLKATPVAKPTPASFAKCMLPVADGRGDVALGLPRIAARSKTVGDVRATVVFVDFPDMTSRPTPEAALSLVVPRATEIFKELSYGRLNYLIEPNFKWYMMSKPSTAYSYATFRSHHDFVKEVISIADPTTDFSKTNTLVVITNPYQRALSFGPAMTFPYSEGFVVDGNLINNGTTSGSDINYWGPAWLNHEIGHSFGLADLYAYDASSNETFKYTGEFSLMGLSDERSQAPGLLAWERFVLGWLDQSQMICAPSGVGTYNISPVATAGGTKAVVIPTGATTALIVESRKAIGLDSKLSKPGLLVYRVNTSIQSGRGVVQVISKTPYADDPRYFKAPLAFGETLTVDGFTFANKSTSPDVDVLVVTR
jgi:M6 family metalloprotease-like protein